MCLILKMRCNIFHTTAFVVFSYAGIEVVFIRRIIAKTLQGINIKDIFFNKGEYVLGQFSRVSLIIAVIFKRFKTPALYLLGDHCSVKRGETGLKFTSELPNPVTILR